MDFSHRVCGRSLVPMTLFGSLRSKALRLDLSPLPPQELGMLGVVGVANGCLPACLLQHLSVGMVLHAGDDVAAC